jgi:hypothetical protein
MLLPGVRQEWGVPPPTHTASTHQAPAAAAVDSSKHEKKLSITNKRYNSCNYPLSKKIFTDLQLN